VARVPLSTTSVDTPVNPWRDRVACRVGFVEDQFVGASVIASWRHLASHGGINRDTLCHDLPDGRSIVEVFLAFVSDCSNRNSIC